MFMRMGALLLMAGLMSGVAAASPRHHNCENRIRNEEHKLHQAERRHGSNSRQAMHARQKLEQLRANCR